MHAKIGLSAYVIIWSCTCTSLASEVQIERVFFIEFSKLRKINHEFIHSFRLKQNLIETLVKLSTRVFYIIL